MIAIRAIHLSPRKQRKADAKLERQVAKASRWVAISAPPPRAPMPDSERCTAMTLVGHRCTLAAGHAEGHMGVLPDGVAPNPDIGVTLWCRWQRHSDDFD